MSIPTYEELNLLCMAMCRPLCHPRRIQIVYALHKQSQHVFDLARLLEMPQSAVSRHLAVLREHTLVTPTRDGAMTTYHLSEPRLIAVLDALRTVLKDVISQQAEILATKLLI